MQKTIYIATEEIWESIKAEAEFVKTSVSSYLVSLHQANMTQGKRDVVSAEFKQEPEVQPDQQKMKKTEKKIKPNPIKKKTSEESSSDRYFRPHHKPEKKVKK